MNNLLNPYEAIFQRLSNIEAILTQRKELDVPTAYLTVQKAADFLGKTANALRVMVNKDQIPYIKKQSKLFFRKSDLIEWLESGRVHSGALDAETILSRNTKKGI